MEMAQNCVIILVLDKKICNRRKQKVLSCEENMEDEDMKKRSVIVAKLCSMCLAVCTPIPAMADASKVVTLGADLTDEQKNTMMN